MIPTKRKVITLRYENKRKGKGYRLKNAFIITNIFNELHE